MTRAWTRSCAAWSVRKGHIFLMLCSANMEDRPVFAMCSLKVSWSSKITPRFLTEADGVIVDEPNWIVKSCCRVGVARKTRSLVFESNSLIEQCVISVAIVGEATCLYDGTQWCSVCGEEEGSKNRALGNPSDQLMCFGYLPSPGHNERPTSEIGFKPAKWNYRPRTWRQTGRETWWWCRPLQTCESRQ